MMCGGCHLWWNNLKINFLFEFLELFDSFEWDELLEVVQVIDEAVLGNSELFCVVFLSGLGSPWTGVCPNLTLVFCHQTGGHVVPLSSSCTVGLFRTEILGSGKLTRRREGFFAILWRGLDVGSDFALIRLTLIVDFCSSWMIPDSLKTQQTAEHIQ